MNNQSVIILSTLLVLVMCIAAASLLNEPAGRRKAKPYFILFFLLSLISISLLGKIPYFTSEYVPMLLDIAIAISSCCLTLGLTIRMEKRKLEQTTQAITAAYVVFVFLGPYYVASYMILTLILSVIEIYALITRHAYPNRGDLGLLLFKLLYMGLMLTALAHSWAMNRQELYDHVMVNSLISAPVYFSGIAICLLASYLIDNLALLRQQATTDELTQMLNRRAFFQRVDELISLTKRQGSTAAIIITDIDHFKKINDTYGHEAGDKAIQQFSKLIIDSVRDYDLTARYGGEEFLIFLPETNLDSAILIAERIRAKCEATPVKYEDKQIIFTASFGVANYQLDKDPDHTIKLADSALYQAKGNGRNQVISAL